MPGAVPVPLIRALAALRRARPAPQGINVVALVERGRRDGFHVSVDRNRAEMAGAILAGLGGQLKGG